MQNVLDVFSDYFGETSLLLFGFAWPPTTSRSHEALFSPYVHALISRGMTLTVAECKRAPITSVGSCGGDHRQRSLSRFELCD
jgi:hypothetical protein